MLGMPKNTPEGAQLDGCQGTSNKTTTAPSTSNSHQNGPNREDQHGSEKTGMSVTLDGAEVLEGEGCWSLAHM